MFFVGFSSNKPMHLGCQKKASSVSLQLTEVAHVSQWHIHYIPLAVVFSRTDVFKVRAPPGSSQFYYQLQACENVWTFHRI